MTSKTDELRAIFARLSDRSTFTERQLPERRDFHSDEHIDRELRAVIREMRDRYRFRTKLSDDDLVVLVRGYYADRSDLEIARLLGDDALVDVVARARINLHLFRDEDMNAPFDIEELKRLLERGVSLAECARELGASESTVGKYRHIVAKMREAMRASHRYQAEFETILEKTDLTKELGTSVIVDRRTMEEVKD